MMFDKRMDVTRPATAGKWRVSADVFDTTAFTVKQISCAVGQAFSPEHKRCCSFTDDLLSAVRCGDHVQLYSTAAELSAIVSTVPAPRVVLGDVTVLRAEPFAADASGMTCAVSLPLSLSVTVECQEGRQDEDATVPPFLVAKLDLERHDASTNVEAHDKASTHVIVVPLVSLSFPRATYQLVSNQHLHRFAFPASAFDREDVPRNKLGLSLSIFATTESVTRVILARVAEAQQRIEKKCVQNFFFGVSPAIEQAQLQHEQLAASLRSAVEALPTSPGFTCGTCLIELRRDVYLSFCTRAKLVSTRNVIPLRAVNLERGGDDDVRQVDIARRRRLESMVAKSILISQLLEELRVALLPGLP